MIHIHKTALRRVPAVLRHRGTDRVGRLSRLPSPSTEYSVLVCLRNQPLETQCWILAQFLS